MRRNLSISVGLAAGVTAIALVATPALAQAGPWAASTTPVSGTCTGDGTGPAGTGPGMGRWGAAPGAQGATAMRGQGGGMRNGSGMMGPADVASGTLTTDQKASLASMADDEKLAHDLYTALGAKYPADPQLARIARAESMHLAAVRTLLTRYGITDPTAGLAEGTFASTRAQSLYDSLLAGATTSAKSLAAGITVEKTDIADLSSAKSGVTAPDVLRVYTTMITASQRHLSAFGG